MGVPDKTVVGYEAAADRIGLTMISPVHRMRSCGIQITPGFADQAHFSRTLKRTLGARA
jgi:hypothetical protein